mmetsp:Transcript_100689/g.260045  ORF Transcript_100689/g.260045 Transcript_100689/m.260045 type:complete len:602 (-) Transcript_100689:66-1871(-)
MAVSPSPPPEDSAGTEWGDEQLAEAIKLFRSGDFAQAQTLAAEAAAAVRPPKAGEGLGDAVTPSAGKEGEEGEADSWRVALDNLARSHEDGGDTERAEALYLRMLAWREGAEQYRQGHFGVASQLFKKSPEYRTVEDATWFLQTLRPDDGHAVPEVVGLLALGEEVAAKAAVALWTLALRPKQRPKITECGGLELLAKAIAYHVENPELQAAGCGALRLLCSGHPLAKRNRISLVTRLGGVEALAAALKYHRQDIEVQREACGALRAVSSKHPAGARRCVENDCIMVCLNAISACADEAVGEAACKALEAMRCASEAGEGASDSATDDVEAIMEAKLRAEREGGLYVCDRELRRHLHETDKIASQALICAANIFLDDAGMRHRGMILIDAVVACMQMFPAQAKIQRPACGLLCRLASGHLARDEAVAKIASGGGVATLCLAMRDLPLETELQRMAISTLGNITHGSDANKTLAVKAGAISVIVQAMVRNSKDANIQESGITALTSICDTMGRATVCARLGGVEAIVEALRKHAGTGHVAELGCVMLCMLCDDSQLRLHIQRSGGFAIAKTLSRAGQPEVKHWGSELVRELTETDGRERLVS